jgi:predicted Zn finger-like uncharacterized protein
MKIVCDACQAKYSISDDKVQGKVFKIRCKKCSNIIVVRGGASVAEPAPQPQQEKDTRVYDYGYEGGDRAPAGDEAVWHVVINQDQVGPMTAVDVQRRFASGEIDAETYIWREGFPDWLPFNQVDTFAGLLASSGAAAAPAAAAPRGGGAEAVAAMFGGEDVGAARSDPGDLFAAASASSAHSDDDGGDLFGSKPAGAQGSQGAKLRGERNENSVLFSLNNLAQLASDKPAPAPRPGLPASPPVGAATGPSSGEGSGLIDIRSMANAYLGAPAGAPKPASAGIGSIDDLPVFGGGGFTEPAVIVPISARSNSNKLLYALIGSVGLLAVAAVVVAVVLFTSKSSAPTAPTRSEPVAAAEPKPDGTKPAAAAPEPAAAGAPAGDSAAGGTAPPAGGAAAAAPGAAAGASGSPPASTGGDRTVKAAVADNPQHAAPPATHKATTSPTPAPPKATSKPDKVAAAPPPPAKEAPPPKADKGGGGGGGGGGDCDEVSCVLNSYEGACCAKFRKGGGSKPAGGGSAPKAAGGGDLPDGLDRTMIADGVAKVKQKAQACGDKSPAKGQVKVAVKVGPDGSVVNVTVRNTPDPGLGNCVAGAMQTAKFPRTQSGGSFAYPFQF